MENVLRGPVAGGVLAGRPTGRTEIRARARWLAIDETMATFADTPDDKSPAARDEKGSQLKIIDNPGRNPLETFP
jgi:hypothetical protein